MLKKMIRFARGTLHFRIQGSYPERFINLCARGGVGLWASRREGDDLVACTALRHQKQVEYYAGKAGAELTVLSCTGAQPTVRRYRRRKGILIGAVLLVLGFLVMGRLVWRIDVRGNERLGTEEIVETLAKNGVHIGSWASRVNAREVERRMMVSFDEIAWVAVNIDGSTATVVIEEAVIPPAAIDDNIPTNVVAGKAGYITRIEAYDGNKVVAVGDTVLPGQLLISGIMDNKMGESRTAHARGHIIAQTRETLSVTVSYRQESFRFKGVARRNYITFFGLPIPLQLAGKPAEPYRLDRVEYSPHGLLALLPVTRIEECYLLLERTAHTITLEEAQALAEAQLSALEQQELLGSTILSRELTGVELSSGWQLCAEYLCEEEIGVEQPISVVPPA